MAWKHVCQYSAGYYTCHLRDEIRHNMDYVPKTAEAKWQPQTKIKVTTST